MARVAILVDGGFYRKRSKDLSGNTSAKDAAEALVKYCHKHLLDGDQLYRIFYYDCPPISKKMYHPFLKEDVDFSKTPLRAWFDAFIGELTKKRKVALRLGRLSEENASYILSGATIKKLCDGELLFEDLTEKHFILDVRQKGVDMKIGVDIASLAYKSRSIELCS